MIHRRLARFARAVRGAPLARVAFGKQPCRDGDERQQKTGAQFD